MSKSKETQQTQELNEPQNQHKSNLDALKNRIDELKKIIDDFSEKQSIPGYIIPVECGICVREYELLLNKLNEL